MDPATPPDKKKVRIRKKVMNPEMLAEERRARIFAVAERVAWIAAIALLIWMTYYLLDAAFTPKNVGR